ncbi:hypothetical protein SAMN05660690_2184 [Geodermatophilus telluris]|uniref:Uncharacterized protein n=1 Tax=Geodermatophilus telluris TaxID=1190417 RepID=A0A1G6NRQ8_9ACTN|nr:hypothetical protein SAMN05660690_2184 [Geodermatophilus telluris]
MANRTGSNRRLTSRGRLAARFGNRGFSEAQATSGDPDDPTSEWHMAWLRSWHCHECGYLVTVGSGDGAIEMAADHHRAERHRRGSVGQPDPGPLSA